MNNTEYTFSGFVTNWKVYGMYYNGAIQLNDPRPALSFWSRHRSHGVQPINVWTGDQLQKWINDYPNFLTTLLEETKIVAELLEKFPEVPQLLCSQF
jgi:hypothetical protein